ncbi:MAG: hypothetical protein Q8P86_01190, partial [bacterium]|nr:hypothetical protein [bacterium]
GLFERKFIVYGNRIFENQEAKVFVMEKLKEIAVSENIFILLEGPVDAAALKKIEKAGGKVQKYGEKNEAKEKKDFSLTEALGRRDKKTLWVLFQKEIMKGKEVEELHGLLFWQIKSMIVSLNSRSAVEAEMHPFVFQKSRAFAKNYSEDELKNLSSKLVSLYHDSRRGLHDFNTALERFILTI